MDKTLIVCITGERNNDSFEHTINVVLNSLIDITDDKIKLKIIFGDCSGVDTTAKKLCIEKGINYQVHPANWDLHGKAAGPIRNAQMIDIANVVYAFHSNIKNSKGTKNTIKLAKGKGIQYRLFEE